MLDFLATISVEIWGMIIIPTLGLVCGFIAYRYPRTSKIKTKKMPTLPPLTLPGLIGRDEDVRRIDTHFDMQQWPVIISGSAGIGKTVLAEAYGTYATTQKRRYAGWVLLPLTSRSEMDTKIGDIADHFDIDKNVHNLTQSVFQAMAASGKKWLVILDNADSPEEIKRARETIRDHNKIDFIITTQVKDWASIEYKAIELLALSKEFAIKLLSETSGCPVDDKLEALAVKTLQCLPLPITLAGAELKTTGMTLDAYEVNFNRLLATLPDGARYPKELGAAITLGLNRLDDSARALLNIAAFMHADDIDFGHFIRGVEGIKQDGYASLPAPLHDLCSDETALKLALGKCAQHSLLVPTKWRDEDTFRMHRTTQNVLQNAMSEDEQAETIGLAARLGAAQMPPKPQYNIAAWPQMYRLTPHVSALLPFAENAEGDDAKRMFYFMSQIAVFIINARQDFEFVLTLQDASLKITEKVYSQKHQDFTTSLGNLADTQSELGKMKKGVEKEALDQAAEINFMRAIEIETEIGCSPLSMAYTYNNLASFYWARKRFEAAEENYQTALKLLTDNKAETHLIGSTQNNLGVLYNGWAYRLTAGDEKNEKRTQAMTYLNLGLDNRKKGLGPIHVETAGSENILASVYLEIEDTEKSLYHSARSAAIIMIMLQAGQIEDDNPSLISFTQYYSSLIKKHGKPQDEGRALLRETIETLREEQKAWVAQKIADQNPEPKT